MGKSTMLRASDVRALLDLLGECRDLGDDRVAWRGHLLASLATLVDAEGGFTGEMAGCGDPRTVRDLGVVLWWRADVRKPWTLDAEQAELIRDPRNWRATDAYHARNRGGDALCLSRVDVIDDATWRTMPDYTVARQLLGVDHRMWCFVPIGGGGPDDQSGIILARNLGRPDFRPRDRTLVAFVHRELARLIGPRLARFADPSPADLTPRVRQVLSCLLEGDGDKQVAARLGLSPHTVNEYAKVIFRHFGVQSRAELLARWVRRGWACPSSRGD